MAVFHSFSDLLAWLDGRGMFHMELGLDRMEAGLAALDLKRPPYVVCQVLGTNGKGSTAAFIASLLEASGLTVGLYTSPHFLSPLERCRVNGVMAEADEWLAAANEVAAKVPHWDNLTYFEFITLISLLIFKSRHCQAVVLEAGLGGKNDATTAVPAAALCFTPIALDHAGVIGPTLTDIARDKAAAMRYGGAVFSGPQFPLVKLILEETAAETNCALLFCQPWPMPLNSHLTGSFQADNAGVAAACCQYLLGLLDLPALDMESINTALKKTFIPGRRQFIAASDRHPPLLLDGGHNPHAVCKCAGEKGDKPETVIFSCLADKDWRPGLGLLLRAHRKASFLVPQLHNSRAENAEKIAAWLNHLAPGKGRAVTGEDSVRTALSLARDQNPAGLVLVTGSFFLLAEIYQFFPAYLEQS